jgi:chromosome segregation ATPase
VKKRPDATMMIIVLLFAGIVGFALFRPASPQPSPYKEMTTAISRVGTQVVELNKQMKEGKTDILKLAKEGEQILGALNSVKTEMKGMNKQMEEMKAVRSEIAKLRTMMKGELSSLRSEIQSAKREANATKQLVLEQGEKVAQEVDAKTVELEQDAN